MRKKTIVYRPALDNFRALMAATIGLLGVLGADSRETPRGSKSQGRLAREVPALNIKVLAFARGQVGKKVGNGECTSLATEALRYAGARRYTMRGMGGDYVWGRPVASFGEAIPGDIVQFRDAVFRGKSRLPGRRMLSWWQEFPHHTAILSGIQDRGWVVTVLHQNVGPEGTPDQVKRLVKEATIRTGALQPGGKVWIYRPVTREEDSQRDAGGVLPGVLVPERAGPPEGDGAS